MPEHRLQKMHGAVHVVLVIGGGIARRFTDDDLACEMHDGVESMRFESLLDGARIAKIADNQVAPPNGVAVAAREIVEDNDAITALRQLLAHMRTDIAGAATD